MGNISSNFKIILAKNRFDKSLINRRFTSMNKQLSKFVNEKNLRTRRSFKLLKQPSRDTAWHLSISKFVLPSPSASTKRCHDKLIISYQLIYIYIYIYTHIYIYQLDLVPFVQFKKREKHPRRSDTFRKIAVANLPKSCNFTDSITSPWVFFTFFKLCKRYQIAQCVSYDIFVGLC